MADWLIANPSPIGGSGVTVELDKAKFGKEKYNEGAYHEGVDRNI